MTLRCLFVDFNSYFASVEQQENPALRGRPVGVVPVDADSTCCIAASIEAKRHGVGTGTLARDARRLCPGIALVLARPALYVAWHHRLLAAIDRVIPLGVIGSIDEVACELTGSQRRRDRAEALAHAVKAEIRRETGGGAIRCSIGIAPNALLAKTASDMQKPDGLVVIEQADLPQALHALELRDLCGIGAAMEARLHAHGIRTMAQLAAADKLALRRAWGGIEGERMWAQLRGEWLPPRASERGSVGHSHVLPPELRTPPGAQAVAKKLLVKAAQRLRGYGLLAGALALRMRLLGTDARLEADLEFDPTDDTRTLLHMLARMLDARALPRRARPLSVSVTLHRVIERAHSSRSLFDDGRADDALNTVLDRINRRYGHNTLYFGGMHAALDAAPMRIPFSHVPDVASERDADHELWLKRVNQAKVLAEGAHRRAGARRDDGGDAKLPRPGPGEDRA